MLKMLRVATSLLKQARKMIFYLGSVCECLVLAKFVQEFLACIVVILVQEACKEKFWLKNVIKIKKMGLQNEFI